MKATRTSKRVKSGLTFRHVVVPTDLTERTSLALQLADRLANAGASRITLLHVIETVDGLEFGELKPFYRRLERKARAAMRGFARRAHAASVVVYGRRAEEIVRFAGTHNVDLIVLASHPVNTSTATRDWGTISYQVGILAQCPVLLVK